MKTSMSSRVVNIIVACGIVLTLLALLATPLLLTAFLKSAYSILDQDMVTVITSSIYLCAVPFVMALFQLKKLSKIALGGNPFTYHTAKALKVIAVCAFIEIVLFNGCSVFLIYVYDLFLYAATIVPMVVVTFIALTGGLLSLTLAQLFEEAARIKEENDQTI